MDYMCLEDKQTEKKILPDNRNRLDMSNSWHIPSRQVHFSNLRDSKIPPSIDLLVLSKLFHCNNSQQCKRNNHLLPANWCVRQIFLVDKLSSSTLYLLDNSSLADNQKHWWSIWSNRSSSQLDKYHTPLHRYDSCNNRIGKTKDTMSLLDNISLEGTAHTSPHKGK
jgi:hypothetical protein